MLMNILSPLKGIASKVGGKTVAVIIVLAVVLLAAFGIWRRYGGKYVMLFLAGLLCMVLLVCLVIFIWEFIRKRRKGKMEDALARESLKEKQQEVKEAVRGIRERWTSAVSTLKQSGKDMYELPWVLLIGEPQSGKTTTLRKSGLDFPVGSEALSGAGGTVNCDWWFTNDAVVIDTAGRFTMPVDAAPDRDEWRAFLGLLAKYRPKCPVNGVIVTIPATSLLEDPQEDIIDKALKIREKLLELVSVLSVEFPVYVMVSKSDLIQGFAEFFSSLAAGENNQMLGWNMDEVSPAYFDHAEFSRRFDEQKDRLNQWGLRRLRDSQPGPDADGIHLFPHGFTQIKDKLKTYLETVFRDDRFNVPLIWRGCWFSSGLQEGRTLFNTLTKGERERDGEFVRHAEKALVQSRPYFIHYFYKKVFLERGLVRRTGRSLLGEKRLRWAAAAVALILAVTVGSVLWSGYRSLNRILEPINSNVYVADNILRRDKMFPTERAGDVSSLVKALDDGISRLNDDGVSLRFLRGGGNSIARDIRRIEDALLVKGVFRPFFHTAARDIPKAVLKTDREKDQFVSVLTGMLGIMGQKSGSDVPLKPFFELLPIAQGPRADWANIEPANLAALWRTYPRADFRGTVVHEDLRTLMHMRRGFTVLHNFWRTYPFQHWNKWKNNIQSIFKAYVNFLDIARGKRSGRAVADMSEQAAAFKGVADTLLGRKRDENFISYEALYNSCVRDYDLLAAAVPGQSSGDMYMGLRHALNRHGMSCARVKTGIGEVDADFLNSYRHILQQDGEVNPELEVVSKALAGAMDFNRLFSQEHRNLLLKEQADPVTLPPLFDKWHQDWNAQKKAAFEKLTEQLKDIKAKGWQRDDLLKALDFYLKNAVWKADREAVAEAGRIFLLNWRLTAKSLSPGVTPPVAARTDWLKSRFELIAGLLRHLREKYPSHPGVSDISASMEKAVEDFYHDYLIFWKNTLDDFKPATAMLNTRTWSEFKRKIIQRQGVVLDTAGWPLNVFLEHVSLTSLKELKNFFGPGGKTGISAVERDIQRTAYVYEGISNHRAELERAQEKFFQLVESLSDDPVAAKGEMQPDAEGVNALISFARNVERDGISRGERFAGRVAAVEKHGGSLLERTHRSHFARDWRRLMTWRKELGDRFPFEDGRTKSFYSTSEVFLPTVSAHKLAEFFFGDENSLKEIIDKYDLEPEKDAEKDKSAGMNLGRKREAFLKRCIAWRDFLFDGDQKLKSHVVEATLISGASAGKRFTRLDVSGGLSRELTLRFSGKRYKKGTFRWNPDMESRMEFRAVNEENRMSGVLNVSGGSLILPAYTVSYSKSHRRHDRRRWVLRLKFPDHESDNPDKDFVGATIVLKWDEKVPRLIRWPF